MDRLGPLLAGRGPRFLGPSGGFWAETSAARQDNNRMFGILMRDGDYLTANAGCAAASAVPGAGPRDGVPRECPQCRVRSAPFRAPWRNSAPRAHNALPVPRTRARGTGF